MLARWMRLTLLWLLAMVLTGCGGAVDSEGSQGTTGPGEATGSTEGSGEEGETLADFFGWGSDDPEQATAEMREQEEQIQESIRQCMAEEGFEYIPVKQPEGSFVSVDISAEEYAAKQGFGISTWVGNEEAFTGPEVEFVDPNQELVEAMSEGEREAYYAALYGSEEEQREASTFEIDPETGEEIQMMEGFGVGCQGEASEAVYGGQDDPYVELGPELEAMYERIQADPRIVGLNGEWASCMSGKGYQYESQEQMYEAVYEDFQKRLEEIVGPNGGYVDPFEGWTQDEIEAFFEEKTEEEIEAFFEQAQNQEPEYDKTALAALQQEEIALAVAAAECQEGFEEVYSEVSAEYEGEFIAANRDKLEEIKASQRAGSDG